MDRLKAIAMPSTMLTSSQILHKVGGQCSSFLGLVLFFGWECYCDYQEGTTLEGLASFHAGSLPETFLITPRIYQVLWKSNRIHIGSRESLKRPEMILRMQNDSSYMVVSQNRGSPI